MSLRLYAKAVADVNENAVSAKKSVDDLNAAVSDSAGFSAGFRKLLEFKDAQGETGGTTFTKAWQILNEHLDRIEQARDNPTNANLEIYVAQATSKLTDYFRRVYPQLGDVATLIRNLQAFRASEKAADSGSRNVDAADGSTTSTPRGSSSVTVKIPLLPDVAKLLKEVIDGQKRAERAAAATPAPTRTPSTAAPSTNVLVWQGGLRG